MSRVALVHDWMVVEGGAERVALELATMFPDADVYTSFFDEQTFGDRLTVDRVKPWPVQRIVGPTRRFRSFLPLYPLYFGGLTIRHADLVVSSSVAFSHAVQSAPKATHVSYVHTPLRYAWSLDSYLAGSSFSLGARLGSKVLRPALKRWDRATATRPDALIANSETVRRRIQEFWDRDAEVIHPPVDVTEIQPSSADDGYLLVAARMLAYRRLDLAVQAATMLKRDLVVIGDGPERGRLRALAGPSVRFLGRTDRATLLEVMARCHAYVVPGEEDFGIAPVEAMAFGKPVVAYGAGGAIETVIDGETGRFFENPSPASLAAAIEASDATTYDPRRIRVQAERFSRAVFARRFGEMLQRLGVPAELYAGLEPESASTSASVERG